MDNVGIYNIFLKRGSLYHRSIVVADENTDEILDVDGYTAASMLFRDDSCATTAFLSLTLGSGLTFGTGVTFEGIYDNATTYSIGDVVTFVFDSGQKGFFECIVSGAGNLPTDESFWQVYGTILVDITASQTDALTELSGVYDLLLTPSAGADAAFYQLKGTVTIEAGQ